jgi:hypothetical protein
MQQANFTETDDKCGYESRNFIKGKGQKSKTPLRICVTGGIRQDIKITICHEIDEDWIFETHINSVEIHLRDILDACAVWNQGYFSNHPQQEIMARKTVSSALVHFKSLFDLETENLIQIIKKEDSCQNAQKS